MRPPPPSPRTHGFSHRRARDCTPQVARLEAALSEMESKSEGLQGQVARRVAIAAYLGAAANLAGDILGAYGRALVYYLGLA